MKQYPIGFIGTGHMGGALARAAAKTAESLVLANIPEEDGRKLAAELGADFTDNASLAASAHYIVLGLKPQIIGGVLKELAPVLAARKDRFVLVSMAAGVTLATLREALGAPAPIIRIMPNMPASVGEGVVLCTPNEFVTPEETAEFQRLLSAAGLVETIPESRMDVTCALSGSGPAYVYLFIDALAKGAEECGFTREQAVEYAARTVVGAGKMALASGEDPAVLADRVCTPGGTTIEGVHALDAGGFEAACIEAVKAGFRRSQELSR